jgi:hypothetical protein
VREQRPAKSVVQTAKMSFMAQPIPLALFLLNVIGAIGYLARASNGGWAIPQEREAGIHSITGEPLVWHLSDCCIFLCAELRLGSSYRSPTMAGLGFWLLAALVWLGAVAIDFAHH